jgi:hypothetical protein
MREGKGMFDASDLVSVTTWLAYDYASAKTTSLQGWKEEGGVYSKQGRCCQVPSRALRPAWRTVQLADAEQQPVDPVESVKMVWE